jgi:Ceramidase
MKSLKLFLVPLAVFVLIALATLAFSALHYSWAGWGLASCSPHCFCEMFSAGGIVQPLSSYSNLFYFLTGLLILGSRGLSLPGEANNWMTRRRGYITGFGAAVIGIGVTSMFFHVSLTTFGWWLDYMGMYAFVGFALLYSMARFRGWDGRTFLILYAILLTALGLLWVIAPEFKRFLLVGLILALMAAEAVIRHVRRAVRMRSSYFYAALAIFLIAFGINILDDKILCIPVSLWQWHAFWHLLTAIAAGLVYLYYRSENETSAV